jgi:hypothetical protein
MHPEFTARNVAKFVAKSIIAYKTTKLTAETIEEHTQFEKDDMIVELGSGVVGWYVSAKLSPVTDKIVDKTADFITEKREAREYKKNHKKD